MLHGMTATVTLENSSDNMRGDMDALQRSPLAGQALEALLDRITTGEWPLGHRLPGEAALATEFGVGRSTVREAIRELAGRGVLETRQGAGVFVVATAASPDWDTVLRQAEIADLVEGRIAIETEAAHRAATRRTPRDLRSLRTALASREKAAATAPDADYVDADLALHRAIVTAAHNPVLDELFATFLSRLRQGMIDMLRLAGTDTRSHTDHDAHADIVAAIRDRAPDRAAATSREHLVSIHQRFHPDSTIPEGTSQ